MRRWSNLISAHWRDLTPESRGLLAIAQGFSEAYANAAELPVYDALYAWCRLQANAT